MNFPSNVVPGYPYEGSLYWLLGEGCVRHDLAAKGLGYYQNLYGTYPEQLKREASALVALFDTVEMAPCDHALPDLATYLSGDIYFHPQLRLSCSREFNEWPEDTTAFADRLLAENQELTNVLNNANIVDQFAQQQFISRLILQCRIAMKKDAVLIGNHVFEAAYRIVVPRMGAHIEGWPLEPEGVRSLILEPALLDTIGLCVPAATFDAFCLIRDCAEITDYAKNFRDAISTASGQKDLERTLLNLIREAREKDRIAQHAVSALQASGSLSSIAGAAVGALPLGGTITSLIGLGTDLAARRITDSSKSRRWYTFGSKLQELSLDAALNRFTS
jgi:hypothetical protein